MLAHGRETACPGRLIWTRRERTITWTRRESSGAREGRLMIRSEGARHAWPRRNGDRVIVKRIKVCRLRMLKHLGVEEEFKLARADWGELAKHDVLRYALHVVTLGEASCFHEHVNRLLERAAGEGAVVDAVDAMTSHRQEVTSVRHDVAQDGEMAIVDVRAVELDHGTQLTEERLAHRLDAQVPNDLTYVVGHEPCVVYTPVGRSDSGKVDAFRVQNPLSNHPEGAGLGVHGLPLGFAHEYALDLLNAAQCHLRKHVGLYLLQEQVFLLVGTDVLVALIGRVID
mmetsp:Transcript_5666/g.17417  ORF Transcript_5666/g.17417 Transcript_5666/m.17417 type:complete len:285 (-) Transcript_5666:3753-4607(-)